MQYYHNIINCSPQVFTWPEYIRARCDQISWILNSVNYRDSLNIIDPIHLQYYYKAHILIVCRRRFSEHLPQLLVSYIHTYIFMLKFQICDWDSKCHQSRPSMTVFVFCVHTTTLWVNALKVIDKSFAIIYISIFQIHFYL